MTSLCFAQIYDESGPSIEGMGETAGFQGFIYKIEKLGWDISSISPEDVIGTLKGTCTVVGTSNDQLCTYEVLMYNTVDGSSFGTVIASGSITYRTADGGHLIVEAAGDDFAGRDGGILSIRYVQTGSVPILTGELFLS